jgi:hypothetical protein
MYFLYKNEYRNFKPAEITIKGEKWRREPILVIIHIHMEMSQRNQSIATLNKQKCYFLQKQKTKKPPNLLSAYIRVADSFDGKCLEAH